MSDRFRNLLWDFDGVLFDSMPIRDAGFRVIFQDFPEEQVNALLTYHRENGGWSRYVKIRYFFERIRGESVTEETILDYAGNYSDYMKQHMCDPSLMIPETVEWVRTYHDRVNVHIVSGSDGRELNHICTEVQLSPLFQTIAGSPREKKLLVKDVLESYGYPVVETALIGDSKNDFDAAETNQIAFFGYNNPALRRLGTYLESITELTPYCAPS